LTPPNLEVTPESHDFGDVQIGTTSPTQTFTITNTGGQTATGGMLTLGGPQSTSFSASNNTCGFDFSLTGGQSCTVDIALRLLSPFNTTGLKQGELEAEADGTSDTSTFTGNGVTAPNLQISITTNPAAPGTWGTSASHDFGNIPVADGDDDLVHAYIWFRNTGGAGAEITNDPVPVDVVNAIGPLYGFGQNQTTCDTISSQDFPVVLDFDDPVIAGGTQCRAHLHVEYGADDFSYNFTVQSTGGNVSGTISGFGI
jgi:hypothetical protein